MKSISGLIENFMVRDWLIISLETFVHLYIWGEITQRGISMKNLSNFCFIFGFLSVFASIFIWFITGGTTAAEQAHAERFGIFVGLWAPTFFILATHFGQKAGVKNLIFGYLQNSQASQARALCFVLGFASILGSIFMWYAASGDGDQLAHGERFGIFVGLWAPTFFTISNYFGLYTSKTK